MALCLGEVFRVIYNGRHEVKPEEQLGTIKIQSDTCDDYLYKVEDRDMSRPLIKPGDSLPLIGPNKGSFHSRPPFFIYVDLFGGAYKDTIYHGDSRLSGDALEKRILSDDGTGEILVMYSFFYDATEARIEVLLSDKAVAAATADSYGVIAASTSKIDRPGFSSLLLLKESGHSINVGHNGVISLARSIVAVPLGSQLFVDIHMRSGNYEEIVKGTLVFDAEPGLQRERTLNGRRGDILVKVSWTDVPQVEEDASVSNPSEISEDSRFFVPSPEEEVCSSLTGNEKGHNVELMEEEGK